MTTLVHTPRAQLQRLCETWSLNCFHTLLTPPILRLAIFISFLYSSETSRVIITPRTMRWRQLSSPGFKKSRKHFSVTEWKNLLHVERNVLALTMTMLKNKYLVLKLKKCTFCPILLLVIIRVLQACVHCFSAYPRTYIEFPVLSCTMWKLIEF